MRHYIYSYSMVGGLPDGALLAERLAELASGRSMAELVAMTEPKMDELLQDAVERFQLQPTREQKRVAALSVLTILSGLMTVTPKWFSCNDGMLNMLGEAYEAPCPIAEHYRILMEEKVHDAFFLTKAEAYFSAWTQAQRISRIYPTLEQDLEPVTITFATTDDLPPLLMVAFLQSIVQTTPPAGSAE